jgi:protein-S-isoprenylcysteine O-methyltransferase Ste14
MGIFALVWCVRDFYVSGRGTLAPWDPPTRLVIIGLYRFLRNPMYVAVLTILVGWALLYRSWPLAVVPNPIKMTMHGSRSKAECPNQAGSRKGGSHKRTRQV